MTAGGIAGTRSASVETSVAWDGPGVSFSQRLGLVVTVREGVGVRGRNNHRDATHSQHTRTPYAYDKTPIRQNPDTTKPRYDKTPIRIRQNPDTVHTWYCTHDTVHTWRWDWRRGREAVR